MRIVATYLFLFVFTGNIFSQERSDIKKLDSAFTELYKSNRFNGTLLYAEKGKVLYKKAFGVTDYRTKERLLTTSSFNLASVTKQFICMAIMIMKERGQLAYDDDCRKYIPELPYDSISIRNLMTHTSGIPEYFDVFQRFRSPLDTLTNEKMIRLFAAHRPALDFATGVKWNYCNTNYIVLASIIERISKMPIDIYVKRNILTPLGLKDSYVYHVLMPSIPTNHVYGFEETGENRRLNDLTAI